MEGQRFASPYVVVHGSTWYGYDSSYNGASAMLTLLIFVASRLVSPTSDYIHTLGLHTTYLQPPPAPVIVVELNNRPCALLLTRTNKPARPNPNR